MRLARDIELESYNNGKGIRMIIWNQGCQVHCLGCHNPETWNENGGNQYSIEELKEKIYQNRTRHQGITLSGGDPFLQPCDNLELAKYAHSLGLDVWAYCGQKYEDLIKDVNKKMLLQECDILVDGPFILAERDVSLPFRGSRNQRIINVQKSLQQEKIITVED